MGEDLAGVQHPGLQKLRLRVRQQRRAVRQTASVGLHREGHGKFQGPDAPSPSGVYSTVTRTVPEISALPSRISRLWRNTLPVVSMIRAMSGQ